MLKDVPGYEGIFATTKDGRVWRYGFVKTSKSKNGKIVTKKMKPHFVAQYKQRGIIPTYVRWRVTLYTEAGKKNMYVHRLVAMSWLPNPENKPEVNHIDGNPLNNRLENLEWCTKSENERHSHMMRRERKALAVT